MLVEAYDCALLDLDGTLFRGDRAIPGAPEAVARLRTLGVRPVFMTNNSSRSPVAVSSHLRGIGISASPEEVVTSATATAALLASRGYRTAFIIGGPGLREAIGDVGIAAAPDAAPEADAVVVGWDTDVTYERLRIASVLVQRGAALVASNPDRSFPAADGLRWPGAGALLAVVELTTGRNAEVVGKPRAPLYLAAREAGGGGRPLVVGDRLDTDIAGAVSLGWDSLLVLSGVSSRAEITPPVVPTFVGTDLGALFDPP